ncbi:hypothetical protein DVH05_006242 [Phytophthora capsici]|nr:hypothetical protein DVH05_006242 [Phytophthora capsici]
MAAHSADSPVSSPSTTGFGIRKYFQWTSQSTSPSKRSVDQKEAALTELEPQQQQMQRSAVFGSCAQAVGTVASVLFAEVNRCGHYDETTRDNTVTRQAKILYVSLLESVQKERGEWQGFSSSSNNNSGPEDTELVSPRDLLMMNIGTKATADKLGVLNELLEVSFRNLMGPLVPLELYTRHRKVLLRESLAVPPALTTLLAIRKILDRLEREVRHCLLRLLALWDIIAFVNGEAFPLLKTIADKHHHVFSESSEFESMTARKSERQDTVAIDLLQIMVLYRDILFSDIDFILTKQELQISSKLVEDVRENNWPLDSDPAALSEEEDDQFSSDDESYSSDENQTIHDERVLGSSWGLDPALESLALRSRTSSSVLEEEQDDNYEEEAEEGEWSIPSPSHYTYYRHADRKTHRANSPPVSGGAGPLVPVPMLPSSSEGIPPPNKTDSLVSRPITRTPSRHRHSQQSLSSTPGSPTLSAISQTSSSTRSKLKLQIKQRRSSSINDGGRRDRHWQDTASSESRSPPPLSRSTMRSKRMRSAKMPSSRRRRSSVQLADQPVQDKAKPAAAPSFLSAAASALAIPVAAATLCVLATMATLAIYEMRRTPRN